MELSKEEEVVNRKLKQILPHHIKDRQKHIDENTHVEMLRKFYYELLEFAMSTCPSLSPANMYHLRRQIINGICKTKKAWTTLVAALELDDVTEKDMPDFDQARAPGQPSITHIFRGTYGVVMPFMGGGSVIFSVAAASSSSGSSSGRY